VHPFQGWIRERAPSNFRRFDSLETRGQTVDGRNPAPVDMVVYHIIYRVLYIVKGGAGVNFFHQQKESTEKNVTQD